MSKESEYYDRMAEGTEPDRTIGYDPPSSDSSSGSSFRSEPDESDPPERHEENSAA